MLLSNQHKHITNELKETVPLQNAAPKRPPIAISTKQKPEKKVGAKREKENIISCEVKKYLKPDWN